MTRIILIRHGETEWNKEQIFRGRTDIKLNKNGIKQAEYIGKRLADIKIDAIYSSPLSRAKDTADSIAKHHKSLKPIVSEKLNDMNFGKWEGLSIKAVKTNYPGLYKLWKTNPGAVKFPGGCNLKKIENNLSSLLKDTVKSHPGRTVVFVSHRVPLKILILLSLDTSLKQFWEIRIDNASISILEYDKNAGFSLAGLNDTCHLKKIGCLKKDF